MSARLSEIEKQILRQAVARLDRETLRSEITPEESQRAGEWERKAVERAMESRQLGTGSEELKYGS